MKLLIFLTFLVSLTMPKDKIEEGNPITLQRIEVNDLVFNCRTSGLNNTKEGVILLHGFPETSHMWNELIPILAKKGYKVVAPNQRGYNPGSLPREVSEYELKKLCEDILAIGDYYGFERFHLVGHDWGSSVGWALAGLNPDRLLSWSALSVPHWKAFMEAYKTDKEQKKKSRYIGFFKLPYLPEWYFSFNNYSKLIDLWSESSEKQIDIYLEIFSKKRVLKSALNWYRANVGKITPEVSPQLGDVYVPTLLLWGKNDAAIGRKGVEGTDKYMRGPYELMELEAGHWLIQEAFHDVSKAIVNHIETHSLRPEN